MMERIIKLGEAVESTNTQLMKLWRSKYDRI